MRYAPWFALLLGISSASASAQTGPDRQTSSPPEAIDIKIDTTPDDPQFEDCSPAERDAAAISGEIVVCRRKTGSQHRLYSRDEARDRYARETMNEGLVAAPDVAGDGIFRGPATVSGLCLIPPCPPPPAYLIDFDELPEPPAGSDADRIARGLPPLGSEEQTPPAGAEADVSLNPPGSASPAAAPSD